MDDLGSFLDYARSFRGVAYRWGGKNRLEGMDCSGLVAECLKKAGILGYLEEPDAQGLYDRFVGYRALQKLPGDLLFFGASTSAIDHVAIVLDSYSMIESGGGDHTCTTLDTVIKKGAMVRERSLHLRGDLIAIIRPPYPWTTM
jgi:cell wall-associated NlpC family hydrolase